VLHLDVDWDVFAEHGEQAGHLIVVELLGHGTDSRGVSGSYAGTAMQAWWVGRSRVDGLQVVLVKGRVCRIAGRGFL
jgi:hypothetical protein